MLLVLSSYLIKHYSDEVLGNDKQLHQSDKDIIGYENLWNIALNSNDKSIISRATKCLNKLHQDIPSETQKQRYIELRQSFISKCLDFLENAISSEPPNLKHVECCVDILKTLVYDYEAKAIQQEGSGDITIQVKTDKGDNFTWGAAPVWCNDFHSINRKNYIQKNFTLEEIIKDLNYVINELRANNNKIKIFLTLSPVPSQSTFFKNNVILTSSTGKAKLRLAIENILDNYQDVYYISSYENVVYDNKNYKVDNRHVKRNKVGHIFSTFKNY